MRIPLTHVYRAFPELDGFGDDDCRRFVRNVAARRTWSRWLPLAVLAVLAAPLGAVIWALCDGWGGGQIGWLSSLTHAAERLAMLVDSLISGVPALRRLNGTGWMTPMLLGLGAAMVPVLGAMLTRDVLLRRGIASTLVVARCVRCSHSLLGLPLIEVDGEPGVRCPECGHAAALERIGLREQDLLAGAARQAAAAPVGGELTRPC